MRVPPKSVELEREAKTIRDAGSILLNADMYERWGPKDDTEQYAAMMREADAASVSRRAAVEALEAKVAALREADPEAPAVAAWADAHIALLDEFLGRSEADGTGAFVAREERDKWAEVKAGTRARFDQNVYYIRYDPELYAAYFGL